MAKSEKAKRKDKKNRKRKLYDVVLPAGTPADLRREIEYVNALERRMDGIGGPLPPPRIPAGVVGSLERALEAAVLNVYRAYLEMGGTPENWETSEARDACVWLRRLIDSRVEAEDAGDVAA